MPRRMTADRVTGDPEAKVPGCPHPDTGAAGHG
jgi:hypothetical protein